MSDLNDMIPALKRTVAIPGGFAELFPSIADEDLRGLLADSVAEAQLDGFLADYAVDLVANTVTPDLSTGQAVNAAGAMVLLYAMYRVVIAELRNVQNRVNYEAGPVKYEVERTASLLNEILRQLHERKKEFLVRAERNRYAAVDVLMGDLAFVKSTMDYQISPQVHAFHPSTVFGG